MSTRTIRKLYRATRDDIGELHTWRPLPNHELDQIDPFLFLNHHGPQVYPPHNEGLPFGPHPHRGFETVTFIVKGSLTHRDTAGHESVIHEGGVQWMTAGRGLEHAEVSPEEFLRDGGPLEILQLWVNLPSRLKMTEPRYIGLQEADIPQIETDEGRVRLKLIAGEFQGQRGPVESLTDVNMMTVSMTEEGRIVLPAPAAHQVFLYVVQGEVKISGEIVPAFHLADVEADAEAIVVEANRESLLIFGHATPYGEPVVAHGPFVMNSQQEIMQAIRDYHAGKFAGTTAI